MTCNDSNSTITFSLASGGWRGEFDHCGETESDTGADLDALMNQLCTWLDACPLRVARVVAFGAPVKLQDRRTMRTRIEHEWAMELRLARGAVEYTCYSGDSSL